MDWFLVFVPLGFGVLFALMALAPPRPGPGSGEDPYVKATRMAHGGSKLMTSNSSPFLALVLFLIGAGVTGYFLISKLLG